MVAGLSTQMEGSVRIAKRVKTSPFALNSHEQHLQAEATNDRPAQGSQWAPKRFKSSHKVSSQTSRSQHQNTSSTNSSRNYTLTVDTSFDSNNNGTLDSNWGAAPSLLNNSTNDVNNNSLATGPPVYRANWRRDINSVNGTVDLSQYEQNDVDRLYGDALLVYFKNFNELSRQ